MDKNNVLITINKVHDRFGGVAVGKGGKMGLLWVQAFFTLYKSYGSFTSKLKMCLYV